MEKIKENTYDVHLDEHHRRPRSLGGSNDPSNISFVKQPEHRLWHAMFGNMNIFQITERINKIILNNIGKQVIPVFIKGKHIRAQGKNACKTIGKFIYHWKKFIEYCNNSIDETIEWINNVWGDPAYILQIENRVIEKKKNNKLPKKQRFVIRYPDNNKRKK